MSKKTKTNPIPKSMRTPHRYILFFFEKDKIGQKELYLAFNEQLLGLFGSVGLGEMKFALIETNKQTGKGIIQVQRGYERKILPVFGFLEKKLGFQIYSEKTSGTLKTLKEAL